jgi:hypothetical protein
MWIALLRTWKQLVDSYIIPSQCSLHLEMSGISQFACKSMSLAVVKLQTHHLQHVVKGTHVNGQTLKPPTKDQRISKYRAWDKSKLGK